MENTLVTKFTNEPIGWYEYIGNNPFLSKGVTYFIYLGGIITKHEFDVAFVCADTTYLSFVRCLPFKIYEWLPKK